MKIDLHLHLEDRTYSYAQWLIYMAKERCLLDGVCLVEHNADQPPPYLENLRKEMDFPIFWGSEYSSRDGHILVITPTGYFQLDGQGKSMQEVVEKANELGGMAIPVHPFSKKYRVNLGEKIYHLRGLVAIETINGGLSTQENRLAEHARSALGIKGIGGSDAHHDYHIGRAFTIFRNKINTQEELLRELRNGRYSASALQPLRSLHQK